MLQGRAEGPSGGGVPQPRRLVRLPVRIVLPSGLKATAATVSAVGEDLLRLDVVAPPGRQVGQGDVPAGRVSRLGRHPQRLDGPEHPDADLPLLEGGLAALEVEPRQPAVRLGQGRSRGGRAPPQAALSVSRLARQPRLISLVRLCLPVRRGQSASTATATSAAAARPIEPASSLFRRHHRASRSAAEIRRARIGRSSTNRRRSSASAAAVAYRPAGSRAVALAMIVSRSRGTPEPASSAAPALRAARGPSACGDRTPRTPAATPPARRASSPGCTRPTARRSAPRTAPAPCSGWCPGCRRYGSGRRPRPSWPARSRPPRRCRGCPASRFDGLTSRCRMPWRLAYSSASATWMPMRATER